MNDFDDTLDHEEVTTAPGPIPGMTLWVEPRPDYLRPLDEPDWMPGKTHEGMRTDDFVLGLVVNDVAYAMPWWVMKNHHVANLVIDGTPFLVVLCENCSSATCFNPVRPDRRLLTFEVAGTYNGTIFIQDHQTRSGWAPFVGECVSGELEGQALEPLLLYQCLWDEWLSLYPDTLVTSGVGESREGHGAGIVPGSLEKRMAKKALVRDKRLEPNALVLGVTHEGLARAYPIDTLSQASPVINDTVGSAPVVVFHKPGSLLGTAFYRRLAERELHFSPGPELRFLDDETNSEWDITGTCVRGEMAGTRLAFAPSAIEEWYAFRAARKEVDIYEP